MTTSRAYEYKHLLSNFEKMSEELSDTHVNTPAGIFYKNVKQVVQVV